MHSRSTSRGSQRNVSRGRSLAPRRGFLARRGIAANPSLRPGIRLPRVWDGGSRSRVSRPRFSPSAREGGRLVRGTVGCGPRPPERPPLAGGRSFEELRVAAPDVTSESPLCVGRIVRRSIGCGPRSRERRLPSVWEGVRRSIGCGPRSHERSSLLCGEDRSSIHRVRPPISRATPPLCVWGGSFVDPSGAAPDLASDASLAVGRPVRGVRVRPPMPRRKPPLFDRTHHATPRHDHPASREPRDGVIAFS